MQAYVIFTKQCWIWYWCIYTNLLLFISCCAPFIGLKKRLIVTCKNATDTMTLIWHVQLADSISVALVISKDSVNMNTKKIIQVNLILYKALFFVQILKIASLNKMVWQEVRGRSRIASLATGGYIWGRGWGSIFPTITPKCLAQLAVFVIVEVLVCAGGNALVAPSVQRFLSISRHPNNLFRFTFFFFF